MDGWMALLYNYITKAEQPPPPHSAITTSVNLSVTKLKRLCGFPSHHKGRSSERQRFSERVFLLSAAVSKTITRLISVDGGTERGE